ncbi:hypothetical protein POUND7_018367 [Theobroma cacao]
MSCPRVGILDLEIGLSPNELVDIHCINMVISTEISKDRSIDFGTRFRLYPKSKFRVKKRKLNGLISRLCLELVSTVAFRKWVPWPT